MIDQRVLVTAAGPAKKAGRDPPGEQVPARMFESYVRLGDSDSLGDSLRSPETLSEAQRAREVGGAHGHMGPHTMLALSTECLEGEGH